jgi:hypothetical protein
MFPALVFAIFCPKKDRKNVRSGQRKITRQDMKMAEHFNIAVTLLGEKIPPKDRLNTLRALTTVYAPFFVGIDEVCLNNYTNGTSACKKWPVGESLLNEQLGVGDLLFVYGKGSIGASGSRSSVHIEESALGTLFMISLPLLSSEIAQKTEQFLLETVIPPFLEHAKSRG